MVNADSLIAEYRRRFDGASPSVLVRAPGRVNLIGEHVDYHDGLVLPVAIDLSVRALAGPGRPDCVRIYSECMGQYRAFDLQDNPTLPSKGWENYPKGVAMGLQEAGAPLRGTNIYLVSDLPTGAGLASSAALELAVGLALLGASDHAMPLIDLAQICCIAERRYAHVPCGIMDQLACACSRAGHALRIDCRSRDLRHIPWPSDDASIVIVDSGERHKLSESEYSKLARSTESFMRFKISRPEVNSLRDVGLDELNASSISEDPRVRHVVTEIARTAEAADALANGDLARVGRLMLESHRSLRDDYFVSTPRLDDLVEVLTSAPGVYGAKLTGAGFGGCVVAVAERSALPAIESEVRARYDTKYGVQAPVWTTTPCDGARVTKL